MVRYLCPVNAHFIKNVHCRFRLTSKIANTTIAIIAIIVARMMAGVKSGVERSVVGEVGTIDEVGAMVEGGDVGFGDGVG